MKKHLFTTLALLALCLTACSKYTYDTVAKDPLKTRIYTLDNGLKVYMSVDKQTPRIQTYIAVNVGGKNDPSESTGLAHYFEHLMFKGTPNFGTSDYAKEKPLLDQIEANFELYRKTTDEVERTAIYHRIDSLSYEASKYSIPNEYDKLMSTIGSKGTNAYTTKDMTVYVEDIPSNQVENWAKIQSDRFRSPVIRGFHTELETIYEEKNMSLTNTGRKIREALDETLYPNHPYGRQSVIGTQESLKNPSITNVKNYHATYYVPNNMAICVSGDFNPDQMIAMIDKYFGTMKPNKELPKLSFQPEKPITSPIVRDVHSLDAETITLAWRTPGAASDKIEIADLVGMMLYNRRAGLLDMDINQKQLALGTEAFASIQPDYGKIIISGRPKAGQTLDELRELLLAEVAKLRNGDFDEKLLRGTINQFKIMYMQAIDDNNSRADLYVQSFTNGTPWERTVNVLDNLNKITKADVVAWANKYLGDQNYAVINKRQGADPDERKISKPKITPTIVNRDLTSQFVTDIQHSNVNPIEPVFVDYKKDLSVFEQQPGVEVLYKRNETNDLFTLTYLFNEGAADNPLLSWAFNYLTYLGTETRTLQQLNTELFDLGCTFSMRSTGGRSMITISGLGENMEKAMTIVEDLLANTKPDDAILAGLKANQLQGRVNAKLSQESNFSAMMKYLFYGADFVRNTTLTNPQLEALTSDQLIDAVRELLGKEHRILYYGPRSEQELGKSLAAYHKMAEKPAKTKNTHLALQLTPENRVVVAPYLAKQVRYLQLSNRGEHFDVASDAGLTLYNEYFGGSMNAIVFQEMREARGLAYSAQANVMMPAFTDTYYGYMAYIATQNDKLRQAAEAFADIIENMPQSEAAFNIAKEAVLARLQTNRTVKDDVLMNYIDAQDLKLDIDRNKQIYEKVQSMTLADVQAIQQKWVKGRNYLYGILGDPNDIDMKYLETLGPVQVITQEELFGY